MNMAEETRGPERRGQQNVTFASLTSRLDDFKLNDGHAKNLTGDSPEYLLRQETGNLLTIIVLWYRNKQMATQAGSIAELDKLERTFKSKMRDKTFASNVSSKLEGYPSLDVIFTTIREHLGEERKSSRHIWFPTIRKWLRMG